MLENRTRNIQLPLEFKLRGLALDQLKSKVREAITNRHMHKIVDIYYLLVELVVSVETAEITSRFCFVVKQPSQAGQWKGLSLGCTRGR